MVAGTLFIAIDIAGKMYEFSSFCFHITMRVTFWMCLYVMNFAWKLVKNSRINFYIILYCFMALHLSLYLLSCMHVAAYNMVSEIVIIYGNGLTRKYIRKGYDSGDDSRGGNGYQTLISVMPPIPYI